MYADTVTVFNRVAAKTGDTWYAHVLTGVDLNADRMALIAKYGAESKDRAKLHIKYDNGKAGSLDYVQPMEYTGTGITFKSGENFDFFMAGTWDGASVIADNDYTDGFYNYLNSTRDQVYAISSVALYSVIPHFEITGR